MPNLAQPKTWLDNQELLIVKGVYISPGDVLSVEPRIDSINLLDEKSGVSLSPDGGWTPQYPSIEGSGVWADTPLMVGRVPLVMTEGNVIEKMRLNIVASSTAQMLAIKAKFSLFVRYARDYWTESYQIDPVYIHWFASCGMGRQYALIFNMELDWDDKDSPAPTSVLTLTIEREPYWRWLPPGTNPAQWRYEFYNQVYSSSLAVLSTAGNNLVATTPPNRSEFNSDFSSLVSDGAITVAANLIPGDAPALVEFIAVPSSSTRQNFIIGKKTTKIAQSGTNGTPVYAQNNTFNATDGNLITDATRVNDTGACKPAGGANGQRVEISFATATNALRWTNTFVPSINTVNRFIGRWMIFLRCRQVNGSLGDVTMYLRYGMIMASDSDGVKLNVVNPPVIGTTGASTDWGLVYMGVVQSPMLPSKADVESRFGAGVSQGLVSKPFSNFKFGLFALRSTGTAVLYLNDLICIPIDEGSVNIEAVDGSTTGLNILYDETGYSSHGTNDLYSLTSGPSFNKVTGPGMQLTPGVENKLYFVTYDASNKSQIADTFQFYMNIIPRSRGIRGQGNING